MIGMATKPQIIGKAAVLDSPNKKPLRLQVRKQLGGVP